MAPDLNSDSTITSTGRDSDEEVTLLLDESNDSKIAVNADTSAVDGIAEPLYNLLEELFDPGMFRWLRKTLITFVQITYNKTINRLDFCNLLIHFSLYKLCFPCFRDL